MAAAIGSTVCKNEVKLIGTECVKKSYPDFWEDFKKLGGQIKEDGR
jgi:3-phosphoshikimate 1-carboxyvinyltransferase